MVKGEEYCSGAAYGNGCGKAAAIAALLIMIGMLGGAYLLSQADFAPQVSVSDTPAEHAISASATASQKVAPDLLVMQLRVQTEAPTAKDAVQENAGVSAELKNSLKALGLSDEDIQTTGYSVDEVTQTNYTCDEKGYNCRYNYIVTGYRVTNSITLSVKDLSRGGDIIDASSGAGVNQTFVDSIGFTLKDETRRAVQKALLKNAAAEAKAKAQNMADGSGAKLGDAISVAESYSYYPTYYRSNVMAAAMDVEPAPKTELWQGQVEVSATVSASYEIG